MRKMTPGIMILFFYTIVWLAWCLACVIGVIGKTSAGGYGPYILLATFTGLWFAFFFYSLTRAMKQKDIGEICWRCLVVFLGIIILFAGIGVFFTWYDATPGETISLIDVCRRQWPVIYILSFVLTSMTCQTLVYLQREASSR